MTTDQPAEGYGVFWIPLKEPYKWEFRSKNW